MNEEVLCFEGRSSEGIMHQASSRDMETGRMDSLIPSQVSMEELQQNLHYQEPRTSHDDFLEQMLSTIQNCSWFPHPQDLPSSNTNAGHKPSNSPTDEHVVTFLRRSNNGAAAKSLLLQQQQLLRSQPPLSLASADNSVDAYAPFKALPTQLHGREDASVQVLYDRTAGSLDRNSQPRNMHHFHSPPRQVPPLASLSTGGSSGAALQRQRVRARRGQATDPHCIAERLRRERIAERMRALQELVPNGNKTDKASMLDEIIDYVKFLQLQVKIPCQKDTTRRKAACVPVLLQGGEGGRNGNGNQSNDRMTITEHQVAKLMEEDMGSAMQYLQGKGLCLIPISLATAISSATCHHGRTNTSNNHSRPPSTGVESTSNMSRLTVLSATENAINGASKQ